MKEKILYSITVIVTFLFIFLSLPQQIHAASVLWDGGGDGSSWSDGSNWSTDSTPTASDDVTIDSSVTVNINAATTINSLTLGNSGGSTTPTLNFSYDALDAANSSATPAPLVLDDGDLTVYSGATITHSNGTSAIVGTIFINVQTGNSSIQGSINTNGKGYAGGSGSNQPGNGPGKGTSSWAGGGAGYGGAGGSASCCGTGGSQYGSLLIPQTLGSGGGGGGNGPGGNGGGAVKLTTAGSTTISGSITANGANGTTTGQQPGGGGSGGSILITAANITGTGTVTADGGNGVTNTYTSGNGGGGRIYLGYTGSFTLSGTISAIKGSGGNGAVSGTTYVYNTSTSDLLIPSDNGIWLYTDSGSWTFRNLTFNGSVTFQGTGANLFTITSSGATTIGNNVTVTLKGSNSTESDGKGVYLDLTGNVTIPATSSISADSGGYAGGIGSNQVGHGPGKGTSGYAGGGAGYGGVGSDASCCGIGGSTYGSRITPTDLGSGGGGGGNNNGGYGGGAIKLTTDGNLTINGSLTANGGNGTTTGTQPGGGGSGGSILIDIEGTLDGTGSITANGGNGFASGYTSGNGGGGRIAIYSVYNSYTGGITTDKGTGGAGTAGDGSIYIRNVSTQSTTNITNSTATAYGEVIYIGSDTIAQHGHAWDTNTNPSANTFAPLFQWMLNDSAANTTVSESINGTDGTGSQNTSIFTTTGKLNSAFNFDGNDYVTTNNATVNLNDFTISAWFKGTGPILGSGRQESNPRYWYLDDTKFYSKPIQGGTAYQLAYSGVIGGSWNNVIVKRSGSSLTIFLNGTQVAQDNSFTSNALTTYTDWGQFIGRVSYDYSGWQQHRYFTGQIDDVRIYSTALTSEQIALLYNSGTGTETSILQESGTNSQLGAKATTGSFSSSITGLSPSTTYYVRSYVVLSNGTTVYGNEVSFTTKGPVMASTPTNIIQVADGSGQLSFQTTISDSTNLNDSKLKVEYSDDGGTTWYDPYLVSATPNSGTVDVDNTQTYQIGSVDNIDTSSGTVTLTIIWDTQSASNENGSLNGTNQNDLMLRVTGNDLSNDGVTNTTSSFSIDNLDPTAPANFSADTITISLVSPLWDPSTETNFSHYEIWYGTNQSDVENRTGTATEWDNSDDGELATRTTTTTSISGLIQSTLYYLKMWAIDLFGNESSTSTLSVSTLSPTPTPSPTAIPTNTPTPTPVVTSSNSNDPTSTPTPTATNTPSPTSVRLTPTSVPTNTNTPTPTVIVEKQTRPRLVRLDTSSTQNTITLTISYNRPVKLMVNWKKNTDSTSSFEHINEYNTTHTVRLTNVVQNTRYDYNFKGTDRDGLESDIFRGSAYTLPETNTQTQFESPIEVVSQDPEVVEISWETNEPATAVIIVIDDEGNETEVVVSDTPTTEHTVVLKNLDPNKKYTYKVRNIGSDVLEAFVGAVSLPVQAAEDDNAVEEKPVEHTNLSKWIIWIFIFVGIGILIQLRKFILDRFSSRNTRS